MTKDGTCGCCLSGFPFSDLAPITTIENIDWTKWLNRY